MFDLGIRKDWQALPPNISGIIKHVGGILSVEKNVAEILQENDVEVQKGAIDAVIW